MQSTQKKIRVLVVDDSLLARKVIINGLSSRTNLEVVGYAINAIDAQNKVNQLNPDVMVCDVQMPGMTGIDFVKKLLPEHPLPVVLISSLSLGVFDTLHAGAIDFVRKPDGTQSMDIFVSALAQKVEVAAHAKVRRPTVAVPASSAPALGSSAIGQTIIGLGASTGGTEA
ncbi:MAG: response regulator, partial [Lawsonibacter sp.]|nr:response regulator [Lawsonibacter sp.]